MIKSAKEYENNKIVNKTSVDYNDLHFRLIDSKGEVKMVGKSAIELKSQGMAQGTFFIEINEALLDGDKTKIKIGVYNGNELLEVNKTNFLGPRTF